MMLQKTEKAKIIVALDYEELPPLLTLVEKLDPKSCQLKVGKAMFTRFGPELVKRLQQMGFAIFLDLKFHDIPQQVALACTAAADLGVWMTSIHTLGGQEMMVAASNALAKISTPPLLVGITLLTSMSTAQANEVGLQGEASSIVKHLAQLAQNAGLDGVVCSAQEAAMLRSIVKKDFCLVTPGIRLTTEIVDDQKRIVTPAAAIKAGANYLVIGRPITQAKNPEQVVLNIMEQIKSLAFETAINDGQKH